MSWRIKKIKQKVNEQYCSFEKDGAMSFCGAETWLSFSVLVLTDY